MLRSLKTETQDKGISACRVVLIGAVVLVLLSARVGRTLQPPNLPASHSAICSVHHEHGQCFDDESAATRSVSTRTLALMPAASWHRPLSHETVSLPRFQVSGFHYNRPPPSC
jgi:hypothetical protein